MSSTLDPEVQRAWIDHTLSLRAQITSDSGSECNDTSVTEVVAAPSPDPNAVIKLGRK